MMIVVLVLYYTLNSMEQAIPLHTFDNLEACEHTQADLDETEVAPTGARYITSRCITLEHSKIDPDHWNWGGSL
jgi:hypothetical protein